MSFIHSLLLLSSIPLYGYTIFWWSHSPVNRHLDCSHPGAVMNHAATNITFLRTHFCYSWVTKITLGNGIVGLYGKFMFDFPRNCQLTFRSDCTILHFPAYFSRRIKYHPRHPVLKYSEVHFSLSSSVRSLPSDISSPEMTSSL